MPILNLITSRSKLLVLLSVAFLSLNTQAEETGQFRLSEFYAGNSQLRLNGESPSQDFTISLSPLIKVSSATLHIEATSSISLLKRRSILNIRFNNATIGQLAFNPDKPHLSADVVIPNSLWREQYNKVTLSASQYADTCQDSNAPDLWSEVNLYDSSLTIKTSKMVKNLNLQKLSGFFHPGIGGQRSAQIFTFTNNTDANLINEIALPTIAQGLALRAQYQALDFDYQSVTQTDLQSKIFKSLDSNKLQSAYKSSSWYLGAAQRSDQLHVLVGTKETLTESLSTKTMDSIKGAFIKIEQTPEIKIGKKLIVASHIRLIVSGITQEDVVKAARSLAYMDDALNPDSEINILSQTPSTEVQQQNVSLHSDATYSLAQLGAQPITFVGTGLFTKNVQLRLPPDFYVPESAEVKLALNFSYGAGFAEGSILNILINNKTVHGLPIQEHNGGFYNRYMVSVPARLFKGGINRIAFNVNQQAVSASSNYKTSGANYLRFELDNQSKITLPKAAHLVRQPDLKLMAQTGYPFAGFTNQEITSIYITQPKMMSAALTMAGKIAQMSGNLIPNLHVNLGIPEQLTTNAMILARPQDLTDNLFSNVSTAITKTKKWPYRLQNDLYNQVADGAGNLKYNETSEFTIEESSLGEFSVLVASKNPLAKKTGTLFIIASESSDILTSRIEQLIQSPLWSQLSGDFFAWQDAKTPLISMNISNQYQVGEASPWLEASAWSSNHPWYLLGIALLVTLLFCALSYLLLKRRHKKIEGEWE